jgi:hypothetical protein
VWKEIQKGTICGPLIEKLIADGKDITNRVKLRI